MTFVRTSIRSARALFAFDLSLRSVDLTLRLSHRLVDLSLRFALCFTRGARRINAPRAACAASAAATALLTSSSTARSASRTAASPWSETAGLTGKSVLSVRDLDAAVDVAEFDSRATGTNLSLHAMAHILTVLDLQTEVGGDSTVDRTRTNRSIRVRRDDSVRLPLTEFSEIGFVSSS